MKATEDFRIDQAWWSKNKPALMKSTGLGAVMKTYQEAKAKAANLAKEGRYNFEAGKSSVTPFDTARQILETELPTAIAKAKNVAGKVFSDTAKVLDKSKGVLSAEKTLINSYEQEFDKKYKAKYLDPARKEVDELMASLEDEMNDAQTTTKEVERFVNAIAEELKSGKDPEAVLKTVTVDLQKIKERAIALEEQLTRAEKLHHRVSTVHQQGTGNLSFRDRDAFRDDSDEAGLRKNAVLDFYSRTKVLLAGAETAVKKHKAAVSGGTPTDEKLQKRIKTLRNAMIQNQSAARKIENNFSNTILIAKKMVKNVQAAPDLASIKTDGVDIPVDKWLINLEKWEKQSADALTQIERIYAQADKVKEALWKEIAGKDFNSSETEADKKDIESELQGILRYSEGVKTYSQAFPLLAKSLANEFQKKA